MWSSSAPEVIILYEETSRDRNYYKPKVAGHYRIMVKVLQLSNIGLDVAAEQQLHAVMAKLHVWGNVLPPKQAEQVIPSRTPGTHSQEKITEMLTAI